MGMQTPFPQVQASDQCQPSPQPENRGFPYQPSPQLGSPYQPSPQPYTPYQPSQRPSSRVQAGQPIPSPQPDTRCQPSPPRSPYQPSPQSGTPYQPSPQMGFPCQPAPQPGFSCQPPPQPGFHNRIPVAPPTSQLPYQLSPTEPWRVGLFDCLNDPENAIVTLCFPCLTFGQIAEILDSGNTSCAMSAILYCLISSLVGAPWIISCTYRSKLRNRFNLAEDPAPDLFVHCCCEYCALCQEYQELKQRGLDPAIGWHRNIANLQQTQINMMPPMQQRMR